jgi:hypothetical protein
MHFFLVPAMAASVTISMAISISVVFRLPVLKALVKFLHVGIAFNDIFSTMPVIFLFTDVPVVYLHVRDSLTSQVPYFIRRAVMIVGHKA